MQAILKFLFSLMCTVWPGLTFAAEAQPVSATACMPVAYQHVFIPNEVSITKPGKYCLVQDFVQWIRNDWTSGRTGLGNPGQDGILFLGFSDIDVDFAGHILDSGPYENLLGVNLRWLDLVPGQRTRYPRNVRVRNGSIKVPGAGGVGIDFNAGSALCLNLSKLTWVKGITGVCPFEDDKEPRFRARLASANASPYNNENYVIENMTIHAGARAVAIGGANTVLRNNTLEVDGNTAVVLYGPNALIENNTFIVHLDSTIPVPSLPAIIKLRDADGAVIRNNRFIVKPAFPWNQKAEAAVNLLESANVVIENNTLEGVKALVRTDGASTTVEQGNVSK